MNRLQVKDYHGIVVNLSQKNLRIIKALNIIGRRSVIPGLLALYKVGIKAEDLESTIDLLQKNMRGSCFYAHLYRDNELIVVFKSRVMHATPEPASWSDIIDYGRSLHIPVFWLDFKPCRFEDEQF